jgi:cyclophilin family peptidyl-prolyl cis-trans isomerase
MSFVMTCSNMLEMTDASADGVQGCKFHRIVKGFCCQGGDIVRGACRLLSDAPGTCAGSCRQLRAFA